MKKVLLVGAIGAVAYFVFFRGGGLNSETRDMPREDLSDSGKTGYAKGVIREGANLANATVDFVNKMMGN